MKKLIKKLYIACLKNKRKKEKKIWFKILKHSLNHKNTQVVI